MPDSPRRGAEVATSGWSVLGAAARQTSAPQHPQEVYESGIKAQHRGHPEVPSPGHAEWSPGHSMPSCAPSKPPDLCGPELPSPGVHQSGCQLQTPTVWGSPGMGRCYSVLTSEGKLRLGETQASQSLSHLPTEKGSRRSSFGMAGPSRGSAGR